MSINNLGGENVSNIQYKNNCEVIDLLNWENKIVRLTLMGLTSQEIASVANIKQDSVEKLLETAMRRILIRRTTTWPGGINS